MVSPFVSQERAEQVARELALAYLGTVAHVIRTEIQGKPHHYVLKDDWVSGEMIHGTRVSSWQAQGRE